MVNRSKTEDNRFRKGYPKTIVERMPESHGAGEVFLATIAIFTVAGKIICRWWVGKHRLRGTSSPVVLVLRLS